MFVISQFMDPQSELIRQTYERHVSFPEKNNEIGDDVTALAAVFENLGRDFFDFDAVGKLASILNLYMDVAGERVPYVVCEAYVRAFYRFLKIKRVLDEQQLKAFCRISKRCCEIDAKPLDVVRDLIRAQRPWFLNATYVKHVKDAYAIDL